MSLSTTYTKVETDFLLQKIKSELAIGIKGSIKITDAAPTTQGLYLLSDLGTYTNLGSLVTTAGKLNYAYFDGTTWSKVEVALPTVAYNADSLDITSENIAETGKSIWDFINGNTVNIETTTDILPNLSVVHGRLRTAGNIDVPPDTNNKAIGYYEVKNGDIFEVTNRGQVGTTVSNMCLYNETKTFIKTYGSNYGKTANPDGTYTNTYVIDADGFVQFGSYGDFVSIIRTAIRPEAFLVKPTELETKVWDTDNIKDLAVAPNKTSFLITNLVQDSDFTDGKYINNIYGTVNDNAAYSSTLGFIPVKPNTQYIKSDTNRFALYTDANETTFISGGNNTNTFTTGATAKYARVTATPSTKGTYMLVEGSFLPSSYITKGIYYLKRDYIKDLPETVPTLILPRKLHVLSGYENSVYFKAITDKWLPNFYVFSSGWSNRERYARTSTSSAALVVYLKDKRNASVVKSGSITNVLKTTAATTPLKVNVIGDSFTHNGQWYGYSNTILGGLTFVGLRTSYSNGNLKGEGRGGWTLENYFTYYKESVNGYTPFMHPTQNYQYYGSTGFWKVAITNPTAAVSYQAAGFYDVAQSLGIGSDGFRTSPNVNDLMYDTDAASFKYWNGSAWAVISESSLTFEFNYQKYLTLYGIATPDVVAINLGMNDFSANLVSDATFATWKSRMETVIASIHAVNSAIKIAICTHTTQFGNANNNGGFDYLEKNRNLLEARKKVIANFDTAALETANVILVDVGSALDQDFGFDADYEKPSIFYLGTETERTQKNNPHPSQEGYKQMGIRFAAFLQSLR